MSNRIYLSPPHMCGKELEYIQDAFNSNWIAPLGPHVDAFEKEMCLKVGVKHAAALSAGTAALHLSFIMLGVQPGDTVFTSSLTFSATANAITYCGAQPVFIDCSRESWNMDPALLAEELERCAKAGKLPKAVVSVDLYGQCADYDAIQAACAKYEISNQKSQISTKSQITNHKENPNLKSQIPTPNEVKGIPIIEDAAEALGATYKGRNAGTFGLMSILSFNGNKIITTSGGGMLLSDHKEYIDKARFLATQARDPAPHYQHSQIGYNYRMSNLLAAVGRGQLTALDQRVERRREINQYYRKAFADLPGISFMPEAPGCRSTFWLTCIVIEPGQFGATREDIRIALDKNDIESRPIWKPMHMQPVFSHCRMAGGSVSEELFEKGLCIPSGTALTELELERICGIFRSVSKRPSV